MKKRLLIAVLILLSAGAWAQKGGGANKKLYIPRKINPVCENWFIGVGGGVNLYSGELDRVASLGHRLSPALDISLGNWITPMYGVRLQYAGLTAKGVTDRFGKYAQYPYRGYYKEKFNVSNLHADFLWNWSNEFCDYSEDFVWSFVPFIGVGWAHSSGNGRKDNEVAATMGFLNLFHVGKQVDVFLEVRQMLVNQRFDGVVGGKDGEGMTSVTVGLSFNIPSMSKMSKRSSSIVQPDMTDCNEHINELRSMNRSLIDKTRSLASRVDAIEGQVHTKEKTVTDFALALFFELGQSELDKRELVNLDLYVRAALETDPNRKFTLTGSADKATGNREINRHLSEERLECVYQLLVNKYGILKNNLVKKAEGDMNNRYDEPKLNRVVFVE